MIQKWGIIMSEKYYITNGCKFVSSIPNDSVDVDEKSLSTTNALNHAKKFKYSVASKYVESLDNWTTQKMFSRTNGANYVITNATKFVSNKGSIAPGFAAAKSFRSAKDAEDYIKNHRELLKTIKDPIIIDEDFKVVEQSFGKKFSDDQLLNMGIVPPSLKEGRTKIPKKTKEEVFNKADGFCEICGAPLTIEAATVDHILPLSRGGKNVIANYANVCEACNQRKSNNTKKELDQWAEKIITNRISHGDFAAAYPAIRALVRTTLKQYNSGNTSLINIANI